MRWQLISLVERTSAPLSKDSLKLRSIVTLISNEVKLKSKNNKRMTSFLLAFLALGKKVKVGLRQGMLVKVIQRTSYPCRDNSGLTCKGDLDNKNCLTLRTIWAMVQATIQIMKIAWANQVLPASTWQYSWLDSQALIVLLVLASAVL